MPSREYRANASPEVVSGYRQTADMAEDKAAGEPIEAEALAWTHLERYCRLMAESRAMDDDQTPKLRAMQRHGRERPMPSEVMDALAIRRVDTGDGPVRELGLWERAVLELAMGYLSERQRQVFELVAGQRLTPDEAAEAVGRKPNQVRSDLYRARRIIEERVLPKLADLYPRPKKE